jgi:hypothetical protein
VYSKAVTLQAPSPTKVRTQFTFRLQGDFEKPDMDSLATTKGLVEPSLDALSKPVRSARPNNRMNNFNY